MSSHRILVDLTDFWTIKMAARLTSQEALALGEGG